MANKKYIFWGFIFLAILQLAIPGKMIWDNQLVLKHGKDFKFKTAPVDPNDPFRGKYVALRFDPNYLDPKIVRGLNGEKAYASIGLDSLGFAKIESVDKKVPEHKDYLIISIPYHNFKVNRGNEKIYFEYAFDRFYMEESKAPRAEEIYRASLRDSTGVTYALVAVKDGTGIIKDLVVNNSSISSIIQ